MELAPFPAVKSAMIIPVSIGKLLRTGLLHPAHVAGKPPAKNPYVMAKTYSMSW